MEKYDELKEDQKVDKDDCAHNYGMIGHNKEISVSLLLQQCIQPNMTS